MTCVVHALSFAFILKKAAILEWVVYIKYVCKYESRAFLLQVTSTGC